jgi:hypothetical protein
MPDLTTAQFAKRQHLCLKIIQHYCRTGRIPSAYRAGGTGQWLIPEDAAIIRKRVGSGRPRKDGTDPTAPPCAAD